MSVEIDGPYARSREPTDPLPSTAIVRVRNADGTVLQEGSITAPGSTRYSIPQAGGYTVEVETGNFIDAPSGRDPVQTVEYEIYLS